MMIDNLVLSSCVLFFQMQFPNIFIKTIQNVKRFCDIVYIFRYKNEGNEEKEHHMATLLICYQRIFQKRKQRILFEKSGHQFFCRKKLNFHFKPEGQQSNMATLCCHSCLIVKCFLKCRRKIQYMQC